MHIKKINSTRWLAYAFNDDSSTGNCLCSGCQRGRLLLHNRSDYATRWAPTTWFYLPKGAVHFKWDRFYGYRRKLPLHDIRKTNWKAREKSFERDNVRKYLCT